LHDAQALLQNIRLQQQLISGAPFMGADAKQAALLASYRQELTLIGQAMLKLQTDIKGGGLDPAVLQRDQQEMLRLSAAAQGLQQKISAAMHPLRAELQNWANSFGTTAHQIATTIEETIGVSLNALNQYLVTGKFNAQALLQQVEMLGLQVIENLIMQRVMAAINAGAATAQAAVTGPLIAAAFGPAATAVTVATEGQAALAAPGEFALALAGIQAMLLAHTGGRIGDLRQLHSGGLAPDEVPIIAQTGEFMVQRSVAQRAGMMDFLSALNEGMFHGGGGIESFREGGGVRHKGISSWDVPFVIPPVTAGGLATPPERLGDFEFRDIYSPHEMMSYFRMLNMGYIGPIGTPGFLQGPTMIPTTFDPQGYPRAVAVGPLSPDVNIIGGSRHLPERRPKHSGGPIGRLHSGGSTGGSGFGVPQVHVYAFTDLKALTRHMGSREGQKIIFDTVQGRRIDLGIK
jgi:hypothetical protein